MITISAVGDIMPGGILSNVDYGYVHPEVLSFLNNADIRVGTLETAIGNNPSFFKEKMVRQADVIYAKDHDLYKLKHLSINIVSLANNHFFDLGSEGAIHAIQLLDEMGIKHIGAGRNLKEASAPVIEYVDGNSIAFLAFCDWRDDTVGWCPFATNDEMGVNPMYDNYVVSEIKKYKKQYDYVVVMPHWGREHSWKTTKEVYLLSKMMMKAGADLILGSHPHRVQPVVNFKKSSVAYSLGNFLFPDRLIGPPRSTFYPDGIIDFKTLPVTYSYPYVTQVTYKKWMPWARIGMIVTSCLENEIIHSDYQLTLENEEGIVSLYNDEKVVSILNRRKWLIKYLPYPLVRFCERYSSALIRRIGFNR